MLKSVHELVFLCVIMFALMVGIVSMKLLIVLTLVGTTFLACASIAYQPPVKKRNNQHVNFRHLK